MTIKLTPKQQRFVEEYLIDLNATQAAIRAGYAKKRADQIGYENLRKPEIRVSIEQAISERSERTRITADQVLIGLSALAKRCMRAVPVMIKGPNGKTIESGVYKADTPGALRALELLGRHLNLF